MLELLWALLNLILLVAFLGLVIESTKLLRRNINLFAAIIFVLGLLSLAGGRNEQQGQTMKQRFVAEDHLKPYPTKSVAIDLEENLISTIHLDIKYGYEKSGDGVRPIEAYSSRTGFLSGTVWRPKVIVVNTTSDNNGFAYGVNGILEWKLLGLTVYSQPKRYESTHRLEGNDLD